MGLKDQVDASLYAHPDYSFDTMRQIRLSLYSGIDLLPYLERGFTDDSPEEIRLGLEKKLDVSRIPAPLPGGSVDYVNIEAFEMIEKGEKIAVYHRAAGSGV